MTPVVAPAGFEEVELVFGLTDVAWFTKACAAHGDARAVEFLRDYYALVAEAVRGAGGTIVKTLGDGVLFTFPRNRARNAVDALRSLGARANDVCRDFDAQCTFQVRMGVGTLLRGRLGPPGAEREDVIGNALNQLVKMRPQDFVLTPELDALLRSGSD
jgi:class 3 adenylate cyclase